MTGEDANADPNGAPVADDAQAQQDTASVPAESERTLISQDGASDGPTSGVTQLEPGSMLGKYEIRHELGRGAMGAVYLAFDPMIEREVAIKVLPDDVAGRPMALDRFLTEARSTGKLNHPHVVSIYDIAEHNGLYYIVMELLTGGSLSERTENGAAMPWRDACRMVAEAAEGLAAAHAAGLVHRDIKPENLMTTSDGIVKVVDFGLSKLVDAANDTREATTKVGAILGTPQYMSPEQCHTAAVDGRSDIYGLGGTLFRLLTGRLPYQQFPAVMQVMMAHVNKPVPDSLKHKPDLPEACGRIVQRAMAKDPEDRFQDAADMAAELRQLLAGGETAAPTGTDDVEQEYRALKSAVIVEPSKLQAMMQKNAFAAAGIGSIDVCADAAAGRSALEGGSDVLITAMQLPDGQGLELLSEVRARDARMMLVLNSSDSTLDDLIESGQVGPLALVSKKTKPDEILRSIHACTWLDVADGPLTEAIDPTGSRFLVICDSERIPAPFADQVRRLSLLDLQVTTFDDLAAGFVPSGTIDLALAIRTAGAAAGDTAVYAGLLNRVKVDAHAVAALQVDGDRLTLRAVRRGGFAAVTACPLDDTRLTRLVQIVQK